MIEMDFPIDTQESWGDLGAGLIQMQGLAESTVGNHLIHRNPDW